MASMNSLIGLVNWPSKSCKLKSKNKVGHQHFQNLFLITGCGKNKETTSKLFDEDYFGVNLVIFWLTNCCTFIIVCILAKKKDKDNKMMIFVVIGSLPQDYLFLEMLWDTIFVTKIM